MVRLPKTSVIVAGLTTFSCVLGLLLINAPSAFADIYPYFPNDLITDSIMYDSSSMNAASIQTFLTNEGSGLAGLSFTENCSPTSPPSTTGTNPYSYPYTYYKNCGKKESAATIINDAAKAYGINPQVIMATMQKEQSLITTPYSSDGTYTTSLNCAMGYASCASSYTGFFRQVDDGAWQFRTSLDLMTGVNWWGFTPSDYPCATADSSTHLYNNGLYPNNTVTFANPYYGGDPYSVSQPVTITLADASTAALYCYTPYVGPYTTEGSYQGTGYSGSYNFVQAFEQWFGSTTTGAYTYALLGHQIYTDASMSTPQNSTELVAGQRYYATVSVQNTGYISWYQGQVNLGTWAPANRPSKIKDWTWPSTTNNRAGTIQQSNVAPGGTATFGFWFAAPPVSSNIDWEHFNVVADGITWMPDNSNLVFGLKSNPAVYKYWLEGHDLFTDSSMSTPQNSTNLTPGQRYYAYLLVMNTGNTTWYQGQVNLGTWAPANRPSKIKDWTWPSKNNNRAGTIAQSVVPPGGTTTIGFWIKAPPKSSNIDWEHFNIVMDGVAWMQPNNNLVFGIQSR